MTDSLKLCPHNWILIFERNKRGKTPLEKVYEKIPQAVNVLLEEAVKNSGYVEHINSINIEAELDFR